MDVDKLIEAVVNLITTWGLRVVGAIALLIIGRMVASAIRKGVSRSLVRGKVDDTLVPFFSSMAYYLALTIVIIAMLGVFGIPTASFVAVLGAAGLAVGLALQGTLSNFSAGVMLLMFRPFRVGQLVDAGGTLGVVTEIGIFSTSMNSLDNKQIIIPNAQVYGQTLTIYDGNDTRRVDMMVGIGYGDNIGVAIDTINKIIAADARVLKDPAPTVAVFAMGESSVDLVVRPWCKTEDYWKVCWDLTRQFKEGLEAAGCSIPFPQRDVHMIREEDAA